MNSLTVKNFKALSLGVVGATVVGLGLEAAPAEAASIFTSESDFLSNVQSGSYLETFTGLTFTDLTSSLDFAQSGFSYTASTPRSFYIPPPPANPALSSLFFGDALTVTFTSGNVSAFGANFFVADTGNIFPGSLSLSLSDGTTVTLTNPNQNTFRGFIANPGTVFTSLVVRASGNNSAFPYVDNLRVGAAGTAIPTPALLPSLIGLGLGVWRKRKAKMVEAGAEESLNSL